MSLEINIRIRGNQVGLSLYDAGARQELARMEWEDRRDLSQKLFSKIETLLRRKKKLLKDLKKISFECDSPYFDVGRRKKEIRLEEIDSSGKCGFTAWQTGEIIAEVMNFSLEKK